MQKVIYIYFEMLQLARCCGCALLAALGQMQNYDICIGWFYQRKKCCRWKPNKWLLYCSKFERGKLSIECSFYGFSVFWLWSINTVYAFGHRFRSIKFTVSNEIMHSASSSFYILTFQRESIFLAISSNGLSSPRLNTNQKCTGKIHKMQCIYESAKANKNREKSEID